MINILVHYDPKLLDRDYDKAISLYMGLAEQVLEAGANHPLLFLFSETFLTVKSCQLVDRLALHLTGPITVATIKGTSHFDFSDIPALSPLAPGAGLKGPPITIASFQKLASSCS